ncbi:MAG: ribosome small subunit-dependent GTPase A [Bacteroidales bacterium]|nr:ribosome small subunit-dependent GTPase A [Bacteroidales bacterium]
MKGRVIKSTGSWYEVMIDKHTIVHCRLRGKLRTKGLKATNPIAVGDFVDIELATGEDQTGVITSIYERKNYIIRRSVNLSKISHILAANIDNAVIIASIAFPRTSTGFIDRMLVTAEAYEIPVIIIFNKIDLLNSEALKNLQALQDVYHKIGYKTLATSATKDINIDQLIALIKDNVSLFAGHSGVGKSALINRIEPHLTLKTGTLSEIHNKGKHTTTYATMHPLTIGGYIIDTPGIKEFGLIDFDKNELAMFFPEMLSLVTSCRYYNCTHVHEPGCAVKNAVDKGTIALSRYQNYLNMLQGRDMDEDHWNLK